MTTETFRWQYPNEQPNQIIGADSYQLVTEGQCPGVPYGVTVQCRIQQWNLVYLEDREGETEGSFRQYLFPSEEFVPFLTPLVSPIESVELELFGTCPNNRFLTTCLWGKQEIRLKVVDASGVKYSRAIRISRFEPYRTAYTTLGGSSYIHRNTEFNVFIDQIQIDLVRLDGQPDNCCTLFFLKDDEVVYQRSEEICPEVTNIDRQCPPGTCEVDCGSHVCCYDQNGVSVQSFLK